MHVKGSGRKGRLFEVILTEMKMVRNNPLEMLEIKNYSNRKKSEVMDSLINGTEIPKERKWQHKYLKKYYNDNFNKINNKNLTDPRNSSNSKNNKTNNPSISRHNLYTLIKTQR